MRRFWRRLRTSDHWGNVVQLWMVTAVLVLIGAMDLLNPNPAAVQQNWLAVGLFLLAANVVVVALAYLVR